MLEFIRAIVRPIVVLIFAAIIAQVVTEGIEAPEWFIYLATIIISGYFGLRTFEKIRNNKVK